MKKGFPLKIENLQRSVSKFLEENPRPNPFKDNYPGDGWVKAFLKRHPNIVQRTSEGVTQSSANISEKDIRKWFAEIHEYLREIGLWQLLDDPTRVFNGDESGFQLCPKTGKVLAVKGTKNVYSIDTNNSKESITVMFTFSASGKACPPMVVYNYQRIPQKISDGIPKEWGVGRSDNGWMTSELFFEYIANVFHPYLLQTGVTLPVIYFLDGHKTHLTYSVSKLCKELGIELIALYPNATRILQPADVAVFRPVKAAWKDTARTWLLNNPGESITKVNFAGILDEALKKSIKPETLINGFKACGLVPFNPDAIDYEKCLGRDKHNQTKNPQHQELVLSFSQFRQIVGLTKLAQLEAYKNVDSTNEDFQILHNIYDAFTSSFSNFERRRSPIPETSIIAQDSTHQAFETISEVQKIPQDDLIQISDLVDSNLSSNAFTKHFQDIPAELNMTTENYECQELRSDPEHPKLMIRDNNSATEQRSQDFEPIIPIVNTPVKENTTNTPVLQEQEKISDDASLLEKSPAFKIISNSQFAPFLTMPKTPERKGKRHTVRFPYAITSDKYRAMFNEQKEKKESELKIKEERKRVREENKIKKQNEKNNNVKSGRKKMKESTNTCKICSKPTKTNNRLICDMCSSIFHVKCVPNKHQEHVPEDITIDLFVCHVCYSAVNNDENEDEISLEEHSNDEANNNTEENLEAEILFDMYKQEILKM